MVVRRWGLLVVALLVASAGLAFRAPAAVAQDPPPPAYRVQLVGDSLSHAARARFPDDWRVRAENGRALFESMPVLTRAVNGRPQCVVVALGSNDVGQERTRSQMLRAIRQAGEILAGQECVLWTTVKVNGVSSTYGRSWASFARRWNNFLANHARGTILDWNATSRGHRGWFLSDGLHMTRAGRAAYARLLIRGTPSA